jgi:hypothetical protein
MVFIAEARASDLSEEAHGRLSVGLGLILYFLSQ